MLIVPVFNNKKKTVPFICISLILLNTLIYFFVQSGDGGVYRQGQEYYSSSGLGEIELQAYLDYLRKSGEDIPQNILRSDEKGVVYVNRMFADEEFLNLLTSELIITQEAAEYQEWREKRNEYEEIIDSAVINRFGYSPKNNNLIGLFTCMFLHGGIMHLVGNMVFLWLVGAVLEKAIGPSLLLLMYCVSGVCASALFGVVYPMSPGPLVGASGAIAGLMGAYGIIFITRKIRVFYSLGFYFDYAVVPAFALFPIWLINEWVQLEMNEGSHVAYMAHIGGLLAGGLFGVVFRMVIGERIEALFHQEDKDNTLNALLDRGKEKFTALDLTSARQDFAEALALDPRCRQALHHLFLIDKTTPRSEEFHQSARRLLHRLEREAPEEYLRVFEEYRDIAKKPRVSEPVLERITYCYLAANEFDKAAGCLSSLLKRAPENGKIPGYLLRLAKGSGQNNKSTTALKCLRILQAKYATTPEGLEAVEYLRKVPYK